MGGTEQTPAYGQTRLLYSPLLMDICNCTEALLKILVKKLVWKWQVASDSAVAALQWLSRKAKMLQLKPETSCWEPTERGRACLGSGLDPEDALHVHAVSALLPARIGVQSSGSRQS